MPAKSAKQYKFMQAIAHGSSNKIDAGPSKKVAEEFISKTPKKKRSIFMKGEENEVKRMKPPNNMLGVRG
jgi:hypothetical protein